MSPINVLIYVLRRDLRLSDNPILHHLVATNDHGFTHLLPVYVFPAHQIELSGFLRDGAKSPYPEARSQVGRFWRCGPHRTKFTAEAVHSLQDGLEALGSGLIIRAGMISDVLDYIIKGLAAKDCRVGAVWLTDEETVEERRDQRAIKGVCEVHGTNFKLWLDEKYYIDDRDLPFQDMKDLPGVFTTYRRMMEPLRTKPRAPLPRPAKGELPPMPPSELVPAQASPFEIPSSFKELEQKLLRPIQELIPNPPKFPDGAETVHPFQGGEEPALNRLEHLIKSDAVTNYRNTRNGLLGADFSTKLSGYLALGCITARQIHSAMLKLEDGTDGEFKNAKGFGKGENEGSLALRIELLWRDYMRLCARKFKHKLFRLSGFRDDDKIEWLNPPTEERKDKGKSPNQTVDGSAPSGKKEGDGDDDSTSRILQRFLSGNTGLGLIDASQRELFHTGYTSNRARQNVASFLAKHLGIDWRIGAEWYESMLIDYDTSSNWGNWQYVAGVGSDPREARIFNPVKQAFDYDPTAAYVKAWVPEVRHLERFENVFQACTTPQEDWERLGLTGLEMAESPVIRIDFTVAPRSRYARRPNIKRGRGGRRGGFGDRAGTVPGPVEATEPPVIVSSGPPPSQPAGSSRSLDAVAAPIAVGSHPWVSRAQQDQIIAGTSQSPGTAQGDSNQATNAPPVSPTAESSRSQGGGYRGGGYRGGGNYRGRARGFDNWRSFRGGFRGAFSAGRGGGFRGRGGFGENPQAGEFRPQWTTTNPATSSHSA